MNTLDNQKLKQLFPYYSDKLLNQIQLSDYDLNTLVLSFKQFDKDNSGNISADELG